MASPALDVFGQMALDDAVLAAAGGEALVLRFFEWPGGPREAQQPPHGATFGYFQRYEEVRARLEARGGGAAFPLARRPTGGGIVVHDTDLTFSLVFPWSRLASPALVYKDLHRGVHLGLMAQGLASRLWSPPPAGPRPPVDCFAEPSPLDLVHEDGRKFLGGALRRRQGLGLYQGSLRVEGFSAPREALRKAVADGLSLEWKALLVPREVDEKALSEAERLRAERYSTEAWNRRR